MLVTNRSTLSGNTNTREIAITEAQYNNWISGMLIQNAMPNLSADDREFLISGITPEEWDKHFGEEEYDPNDIVCDECASPKGNICTCKVL
jgi:hypothetical protein